MSSQDLSIDRNCSIDRLLSGLKRNAESPFRRILLASKLPAAKFGLRSALVQFTLTLGRQRASVTTYLKADALCDANGLPTIEAARFLDSIYGLVACLSGAKILDKDGKNITEKMAAMAESKLRKETTLGEFGQKGSCVQAIVADHIDLVFHRRLYELNRFNSVTLQDNPGISQTTIDMLQAIRLGKLLRENPAAISAICSVFYELFQNTHFHGRPEANRIEGERPISIRGIMAQSSHRTGGTLRDWLEPSDEPKPIAEYLRGLLKTSDYKGIGELNVFDTGIGLADKMRHFQGLTDFRNREQEYEAVIQCFSEFRSSTGNLGRGRGLPRLVRALTKLKGFLYVRTGRLCLYRDFHLTPYEEGEFDRYKNGLARPLKDWGSSSAELSDFGETAGLTYFILFPHD